MEILETGQGIEMIGAEPLNIDNLQCSYWVFLSDPTVVRNN
jgi:hypothetical protein